MSTSFDEKFVTPSATASRKFICRGVICIDDIGEKQTKLPDNITESLINYFG